MKAEDETQELAEFILVSIPLPGFIVMKAISIRGCLEIVVRFNPVAGIHCNESWNNNTDEDETQSFNPVAGIHCNESGVL